MARIMITIEAESSSIDADAIRDDAVKVIETALSYMFDNLLVTSSTDDEARIS